MRVASDTTDPARKVGGWLCSAVCSHLLQDRNVCYSNYFRGPVCEKKYIPFNCAHMILKFCSWIYSSPKGDEVHETSQGKFVCRIQLLFVQWQSKRRSYRHPRGLAGKCLLSKHVSQN